MIELYFSTETATTPYEIALLLANNNVECQVYNNYSSSRNCNKMTLEPGYYVKLFNLNDRDFKKNVWNIIQPLFHLECAYVKANDTYMGCLLNWPGVFTPSNCPNKNKRTGDDE